MKILLIGASGMIGTRILDEAVRRGHTVIAASRHPDTIKTGAGIEPRQLDVRDTAAVAALAGEADAVVTSMRPRGDGADPAGGTTEFAASVMAALQGTDKRWIIVGGAGSLNFPDGRPVLEIIPEAYKAEPTAMRGVLDTLKTTDLNWTFFSPAVKIQPGERTGHYRSGTTTLLTDDNGESRISAEDYAHALVDELEQPRHIRGQMTVAY